MEGIGKVIAMQRSMKEWDYIIQRDPSRLWASAFEMGSLSFALVIPQLHSKNDDWRT